jgi:hypothetical protein
MKLSFALVENDGGKQPPGWMHDPQKYLCLLPDESDCQVVPFQRQD